MTLETRCGVSARDDLARVLRAHPKTTTPELGRCGCGWYVERGPNAPDAYAAHVADAVLAEWLPTLADDEAVVDGVTRIVCYPALEPSMYLGFTREHLTALATTLSPTSPAPVRSRAAVEHDDRPGSPPTGLGRSASQQT